MGLWEELRELIALLNAQRFRAFLTLFGIILGVGTLVFLSSLVAGSERYMARGLQNASGEDIISVSTRGSDERTGRKGLPLTRFDSRALATAPGMAGNEVLNRYAKKVRYGTRHGQSIYVVGTMPKAAQVYSLQVAEGRFLAQADAWGRNSVVVLGADAVAKVVPEGGSPMGKLVHLQGERFRVIGVLAKKPSQNKGFNWTWDSSVIVPEPVFVERFSKTAAVSELVVKADARAIEDVQLSRLSTTIQAVLTGRHNGVANFDVDDPAKESKARLLTGMIAGALELTIAAVCLVVGGINIMNIMVVTVAQRTREIGIRRSLGATRWSIQRQFLGEAVLLCALGGLLGVVAGNFSAWLLSLVLAQVWGYWPFVMMPLQMAAGFCFAVLTGVLFGWYPARKAAFLSPVECLRAD